MYSEVHNPKDLMDYCQYNSEFCAFQCFVNLLALHSLRLNVKMTDVKCCSTNRNIENSRLPVLLIFIVTNKIHQFSNSYFQPKWQMSFTGINIH